VFQGSDLAHPSLQAIQRHLSTRLPYRRGSRSALAHSQRKNGKVNEYLEYSQGKACSCVNNLNSYRIPASPVQRGTSAAVRGKAFAT
jgi:hypothetical protein